MDLSIESEPPMCTSQDYVITRPTAVSPGPGSGCTTPPPAPKPRGMASQGIADPTRAREAEEMAARPKVRPVRAKNDVTRA